MHSRLAIHPGPIGETAKLNVPRMYQRRVARLERTAAAFESDDYTNRDGSLTGPIVDGKVGSMSFFYRPIPVASSSISWLRSSLSGGFGLTMTHAELTNSFSVFFTQGGTTVLAYNANGLLPLDSKWHWVCAMWDVSVASPDTFIMYFDNKKVNGSVTTQVDTNIDYDNSAGAAENYNVGRSGAVTTSNMDITYQWLDLQNFLDFDIESNRLLFAEKSAFGWIAKDLGINGSGPTGSAPIMFFKGRGEDFLTNHGTGGDFVMGAGNLGNTQGPN